mmetsp:Transcript_18929/g.28556  ORF Transcript_18929/g.28556 Transcript_18929/m.28556 type:complete len:136 (-) Transcript_18929:479-886(-)|eukprot:CAMPEP_0178900390 /NCGR_PEP_ID=MMETSP0786-20121207/3447_1 /TAXON_ID=186022 /ORGANISM="Thalassionema frauenfeldii, Strain CCMP 1798" /LENGTH=135 /DNA_ID=CAMNT_0020571389 /DNA_START=466 /DNA_END=873 /DNA_ORIENTATION=-
MTQQKFPETKSWFDGPSFFPELPPLKNEYNLERQQHAGICLHVVAANISLSNSENAKLLTIVPHERKIITPTPGNGMPPLTSNRKTNNRTRGGTRNRDRGGVFAAKVMETFPSENALENILDVAGDREVWCTARI